MRCPQPVCSPARRDAGSDNNADDGSNRSPDPHSDSSGDADPDGDTDADADAGSTAAAIRYADDANTQRRTNLADLYGFRSRFFRDVRREQRLLEHRRADSRHRERTGCDLHGYRYRRRHL
jgi:hypothetical protein